MTMTAPDSTDLQSLDTNEFAIVFPDGLVGCQDWKRFILTADEDDEEQRCAVLQSLDDPNVSLMVTDPRHLEPSFRAPLSAEDYADLGLTSDQQPMLFCTLSSGDGWLTANLLGPLVLNPITRVAKQVVLLDSRYSTRYPVAPLNPSGA
jgi:flagellar assembly factor FliW